MMLIPVDGIQYSFSTRLPKNAEKSIQFLLIRLLLGTAAISRGSRQVSPGIDYSTWPGRPQPLSGALAVKAFLSAYGVGKTQASFVKETIADNRRLFQDLLSEFSNFFLENDRGSHTAAFVFLYRALERLSFSIPLLYCSTSNDFIGTFNDLKGLFRGSDAGELGLLKKFLNQGRLIDGSILDTACTIDFSASALNGRRFYDAVTVRYSAFASSDPTRLQVEITYRRVPDLFVLLRNRFFHLRSGDGQLNISNRELHDSDEFFGVMNNVFCEFLAVLTLHAIAWKYKA